MKKLPVVIAVVLIIVIIAFTMGVKVLGKILLFKGKGWILDLIME